MSFLIKKSTDIGHALSDERKIASRLLYQNHNFDSLNIAVLGSGVWGTAIASILATKNHKILLYTRSTATAIDINLNHINIKSCNNYPLSHNIIAITSFSELLLGEELIIFIAIPVQSIRNTIKNFLNDIITYNHPQVSKITFVICSKGLEKNTALTPIDIIKDEINNSNHFTIEKIQFFFAVLSGPNLALEVLSGEKSISTLASQDEKFATVCSNLLSTNNIVIENITDLVGLQLCGAYKNVIAIGSGIISKITNNAQNTRAAFITKAIKELTIILEILGDIKTIFTAGGIGDLMLTCYSTKSRNFAFGTKIADGYCYQSLSEQNNQADQIFEGYYTAYGIMVLQEKFSLYLPICTTIYRILYEKHDYRELINLCSAKIHCHCLILCFLSL